MNFLCLVSFFGLMSYTSYISSPTGRMISPEAQGKLWKGQADIRYLATRSDDVNLKNNNVKKPIGSNYQKDSLQTAGEVGLPT